MGLLLRRVDSHLYIRVSDGDDVSVGQQPVVDRGVVDGGAVGGVQVHQDSFFPVPHEFGMSPRYAGIGEAEIHLVTTPDDICSLVYVVRPGGPVLK